MQLLWRFKLQCISPQLAVHVSFCYIDLHNLYASNGYHRSARYADPSVKIPGSSQILVSRLILDGIMERVGTRLVF